MATKMRWIEELPGPVHQPRRPYYQPRGSSKDLHEHAEQLRKHPLRWAEFPRPIVDPRTARQTHTSISSGGLAAYHPGQGFESARRGARVFVRHNPALIDPLVTAYQQGFKAGAAETIDRIRAGVWTLRQIIAEVEEESREPAAG